MGGLADKLASRPAPDEEEDDLGFIGMPKGYVAERQVPGTPVFSDRFSRTTQTSTTAIAPPRYKTPDALAPRSYSPEEIARLQQGLVAAGLIGPETKYRLGLFDSTTASAYKGLLGYANQGGISREEALVELMSAPKVSGDGAAGGGAEGPGYKTQLNTYRQSDPARVRLTAESAFREALGRKPNEKELAKFVARFTTDERREQQKVFDAQDSMVRDELEQAQGTGAVAPEEGGLSESEILDQRLSRLIADAPGRVKKGKKTRSYEEQVRLYNRYKAGKGPKAAKPGTSKHGDGRANDLEYENDETRQWVLQNAGRYGIAFPIYDPNLPRNRDESWHAEVAKGSFTPGAAAPAAAAPGAPPISQSINTTDVDMGARAVEFARNENPNETAAYDIGQQFNNLVALLGKPVV